MVNSATSNATIKELRSIFSTHDLPDIIVSDNGTAFSSAELLLGRHPCSHLDLPQPDLQQQICQKQFQQTAKRGGKRAKKYPEKSRVYAKSFNSSKTSWLAGIVENWLDQNRI